ncbi:MAG TPA: hypothetical protein VGT61_16580 [Thermomicrobiales bacterium]|nr:hypothetical protein [Thermomicrobiales bacterium]
MRLAEARRCAGEPETAEPILAEAVRATADALELASLHHFSLQH